MPNYKITRDVRRGIQSRANKLAQRTVDYALADFPLTIPQIQQIVLPADQVADLKRLREEANIRTIERHQNLRLAFLRAVTPGVRRGLVVALFLPGAGIYVGRSTQYGISTSKFDIDENHYLVPDLINNLSPTEISNLAKWCDRVVRAKRLAEIVEYTVEQILEEDYTPTTSHMHALWPMLGTLTGPEADQRFHNWNPERKPLPWKERFRNPTRSLKQYRPDPAVLEKFGRLIQASDTVILAGDMLEPFKHDTRGVSIRANIEVWEALPGDKVWTR